MNFTLVNFGCKTNRYDAVAMTAPLLTRGYAHVHDPALADLIIVNTCTVTARSDAKARVRIRALHRTNPAARIVVTGCSVETQREALSRLEGVELVLGMAERFSLAARVCAERLDDASALPAGADFDPWRLGIDSFPGRARACLKVQDGCDNACTYCIVPKVRGASRSRHPEDVVREAKRLHANGHREIILTGIHIGHYGKDVGKGIALADLLERILDETAVPVVRLGSLNPDELGDRLLRLMASNDRIAPHLHVPLQSGSDRVLAKMARHYRSHTIEERVLRAAELMPSVNIGSDVIVGFPAEGAEEFRDTYHLIEKLPIGYLHVFRYSERPGTKAAVMEKKAALPEVISRAGEMKMLGRAKRESFHRSMLGRKVMAVEEEREEDGSLFRSTNYLRIRCDERSDGDPVLLKITGLRGDVLTGVLAAESCRVPEGSVR
jgi:threonylcarbamoyladenosine tRNA methylthiotransferase MtaB